MAIPLGVLDVLAPEIEDGDSSSNNTLSSPDEQIEYQNTMLYHVVQSLNHYVSCVARRMRREKKKISNMQHGKSTDSLFKLALQNSYARKHTF